MDTCIQGLGILNPCHEETGDGFDHLAGNNNNNNFGYKLQQFLLFVCLLKDH